MFSQCVFLLIQTWNLRIFVDVNLKFVIIFKFRVFKITKFSFYYLIKVNIPYVRLPRLRFKLPPLHNF